ncbi:outer membrane beta-barrel family protein [Arcticibacter tournemirensis]|uniref:TonB-dependent receptor n=1 Tax=Arcticibacter tournemirensis TaxID=699437 RepID=A0A4Q0MFE7_9SPHI|nr:outer membrane beta-barrel family protein [Arcticibacter tournemirensis]RXF71679.1 TonB-dependent receptor [Arcticibacter tournemirensis]
MKFLMLIITCFSFGVQAQNTEVTGFGIRGKVVDSVSRRPLDFVTVSLKTDNEASVRTAQTNADGTFVFQTLPLAKYILKIASVGYSPKSLTIDFVSNGLKVKDLGTINLIAVSSHLKEVVVTASKPLVSQEIDRISYDLQADPESKGQNVLQMMRKVPLLSLDADDNIQLQGNSNYKILVNGRPSSMMERSPKDILRSMPATSIQRIEVITNPPAKYDAEGLAGIINIITSKKLDNGYNGSVNASYGLPSGGPGVGGSAGMKQGKFGVSIYGGISDHNNPATESLTSRRVLGAEPSVLNQNSRSEGDSRNAYLGSELSLEIDSLHLISAQFNINGNRSETESAQRSGLTESDEILQAYRLDNRRNGRGNGMDAGLNFQLGFKSSKNRLLTFSYRYYRFSDRQNSNLLVSERMNFFNPDYRQNNLSRSSEQTLQVDYVHDIGKLNIEGGVKAIFRDNNTDFGYDSLNTEGVFARDYSRTNQYNNTQKVLSGYNSYQYSLKSWSFKVGFRVEQTIVDADFVSSDTQVKQNYFNLLPSLAVNRKLKNNSAINLAFSQRIQRPGVFDLNPFVDRSNPAFETSGNPRIKPETINSYQLGYSWQKKVSLYLSASYMYSNSMKFRVSSYDSLTNITRTTPQNSGSAKLPGLNYNIKLPLTKMGDLTFNGWLGYGMVKGVNNGIRVKNEGLMHRMNVSAGYRLENSWKLNGGLYWYGGNISPQGRSNSYISSSLGIQKDLVKNKLAFSASASNPFTKYRNNRQEISDPNFIQVNDNQVYFRAYNFNINYRFGKLKEVLKKNKRGIKNDDVSGGGGL